MAALPVKSWSKYYQESSAEVKERYEEKMKLLGCREDPFSRFENKGKAIVSTCNHCVDWTSWPEVTYPNIYNYLILTPGVTHEQLKAYKSMEGYNFYINGKVSSINVTEIPNTGNKNFLFTALVKHSQALSAPALRVWIGIKQCGEVICAHCTCMAGAGEACAHIGALLFTAEANTMIKCQHSCTSLPCSWLPPSHQFVSATKITDMDFKTPKSKLEIQHSSEAADADPTLPPNKKLCTIAPPTLEQIHQLHVRLSRTDGKPVVLSHTEGFSDPYVPVNKSMGFPAPLTDLFDSDTMKLSFPELVEKSSDVYDSYAISGDQASLVEENTREQANSRIWYQQRSGRVTASKLKSIIATNPLKPSHSLIKTICYPDLYSFKSAACKYGVEHEDIARKEYAQRMSKLHTDFEISDTGLIIEPLYPFMGASPDAVVTCTCCGHGVLEVKCPFSCKDKSFQTVANDNSNFFLYEDDNEELKLKTNHAYYYQVQMQMKFAHAQYYDFLVWRKDEFVVDRIVPDVPFINGALAKAELFVKTALLPELIGRWFTKQPAAPAPHVDQTVLDHGSTCDNSNINDDIVLWCYCQRDDSADDMICCDNENCITKWYHYSCVGLTSDDIQEGDWYCPECRPSYT